MKALLMSTGPVQTLKLGQAPAFSCRDLAPKGCRPVQFSTGRAVIPEGIELQVNVALVSNHANRDVGSGVLVS